MIPTGPEHINRRARLLDDVSSRHGGGTYAAGEIVRVMDVRPALNPFGSSSNPSTGYRRVTIAPTDDARRAAVTNANNLEMLAEGGPVTRSGVRHTFAILDETHEWNPTGDARTDRVKARDLMHAHEKVAEAYKALMYAFDHLQEVERR